MTKPRKTPIQKKLEQVQNEFKLQVYTQALQSANNSPWSSLYKSTDNRDSFELGYDSASLRERSKLFYANDPVYRPLVDNLVKNIVGTGWVFNSEDKEAEDQFYVWTKDATEQGHSWEDFLSTVVRWFFVFGDVLLVKRDNKLVLIDPQRINLMAESHEGATVVDGVEIDDLTNNPVAFHIQTSAGKSLRLPASECIWIANTALPAQIRGEPLLSQIADLLEYLYQYTNAAVLSARIAASMSLIITSPDVAGFADYASTRVDLTTPTMTYMPENSKVEQIKSEQPVGNYDAFESNIINQICVAVGLTPAALGRVEKLNFSASKLSLNIARDTYKKWQRYFADYLIQKCWNWQIGKEVEVDIRGSGFRSLDKQVDVQANALAIETGLETMEQVLNESGIYFDEHIEKLKAEQVKLEGIKLNHSQMTQVDKTEEQNNNA